MTPKKVGELAMFTRGASASRWALASVSGRVATSAVGAEGDAIAALLGGA